MHSSNNKGPAQNTDRKVVRHRLVGMEDFQVVALALALPFSLFHLVHGFNPVAQQDDRRTHQKPLI